MEFCFFSAILGKHQEMSKTKQGKLKLGNLSPVNSTPYKQIQGLTQQFTFNFSILKLFYNSDL